MNDELYHIGVSKLDGAPGVGSGRYPLGSGKNPNQHYKHDGRFLNEYREMRKEGLTDQEIIDGFNNRYTDGVHNLMNHNLLRQIKTIDLEKEKNERLDVIESMKKHGDSNVKIAERLGVSEAMVRKYLNNKEKIRKSEARTTANVIKQNVDEKGYIDVGAGVELYMGISKEKLNTAVQLLKEEGYEVHNVKLPQVTNPSKRTTIKVVGPPGSQWADPQNNPEKIKSIEEYSPDKGSKFYKLEYPASISSDRIFVRYGDQGGKKKDGVIELRPGVEDLSLGKSHYAQVRIAVDNSHYLKGMAMYSDDIPDGYDVVFNTNKPSTKGKLEVFKPFEAIKIGMNPDNPFGATIKPNGQYHYIDKDGNEKLGAINKLKEEGNWDEYSKSLASQMLSKQPEALIRRQLDISVKEKYAEYDDILRIKNSAIKKHLLEEFADNCDKAAEELKAAPLPGQTSKVILPLDSMKPNEIYAPTYKDGTQVALIRYPHGGIFEIPKLTVNNRNSKAKKILGNPIDAVGINSEVAEQLSGADFDGDSVIVIPLSKKVNIQNERPLKELIGFDNKAEYAMPEGKSNGMTDQTTQLEMGKISNLISDMTLKGADFSEIARADKHSMVVIDAKKHNLDYKKSFVDNNIAALKEKYQGGKNAGASTIISRAGAEVYVDERKQVLPSDIDKKTGKINYRLTERTYTVKDKKGNPVEKKAQEQVSRMSLVDDAFELLSSKPNPKEIAYAEFANKMKVLAREARKEWLSTKTTPTSVKAKTDYEEEIKSLDDKLKTAKKNAPKERQAQILATHQFRMAKESNPDMTKEDMKRLKDQLLAKARVSLGAGKKEVRVVPTKKEWEAIDSNAISATKLSNILNNMDSEDLKKHVFPTDRKSLSNAQIARIQAMYSTYTIREIADFTGFSVSTITKALKGE